MDIKELKNRLTTENIKDIMSELGAEESPNSTLDYTIYQTGTHHLNWSDGSWKLYFYHATKSFFSYTEAKSYDIISIVQARWDLEGKDYAFPDVLTYIANIAGITESDINIPTRHIHWKELQKYIGKNKKSFMPNCFDIANLKTTPPLKHKMFLDDGISAQTMDKFLIGYYPPKAQITIPVFDGDGNLLGIRARNTIPYMVERKKYQPLKTINEHFKFPTGNALYGINVNKPYIQKSKNVFIFEAEKSVLQCDSFGINNAVALFGTNLTESQRDILIQLGVNTVHIAFDKDYKECVGDEWDKYIKLIKKTANMFKGYAKVYTLTDMGELLGYKESPSDRGKDVFEKLVKKKLEVC